MQAMLILKGPDKEVLSLVFAPDATKLYAVHQGIGVHIWNLADRTVSALDIKRLRVWGEFVVHPGSRWAFGTISIPNNHSNLIDLTAGKSKTFNFVNVWDHVAISPDGKHVAAVGFLKSPPRDSDERFCLSGWKMTTAGPRREWERKSPTDERPWYVIYLDNETLVTEDDIPLRYSKAHRSFRPAHQLAIRSATDGEVKTTFDSPYEGAELRHLLASPDGKQLVARRGTTLWVWNASDWKKPPTVVEGKDSSHLLRAACFHPSGQYLLLAHDAQSVIVLDTTTWKQVRKWNWKVGVLRAVAVSPDGTLAAAAGPRGTVVVWDWDL